MAGSESAQVPVELPLAASVPSSASAVPATTATAPRHSALVRVTHWIATLCFFALLVTGIEIVISHPRFYWGETGNVLTTPLFQLPIPSSRALVKTGYGYVLPDQNGWSRYLHFQAAWIVVLTGLLYVISGFFTGHWRKNLLPRKADLSWRAFSAAISSHLRFARPSTDEAWSYNVLQRISYLIVIFVLFPLVIWTGLAMSLSFVSAFPATVTLLGGEQSARTLHFFVSIALVVFLVVHVVMVCIAGFRSRMRAMITGRMIPGEVIAGQMITEIIVDGPTATQKERT
jgi:thiosulfate reductase cytochrome b subunit